MQLIKSLGKGLSIAFAGVAFLLLGINYVFPAIWKVLDYIEDFFYSFELTRAYADILTITIFLGTIVGLLIGLGLYVEKMEKQEGAVE